MNSAGSSELLAKQLEAMNDPAFRKESRLSNMLAVLFNQDEKISWAGIYTIDPDTLDAELGPFQGKPACMRIPAGKGVISQAVARKNTVCVDDILRHPGHVACDSASRSELVIPLMKNGSIAAVLDLDSDVFAHFSGWTQEEIDLIQGQFESVI